jgi:hypothetical protein
MPRAFRYVAAGMQYVAKSLGVTLFSHITVRGTESRFCCR